MGREQYPNIFFSKKAIDVLTTYRPLILRPGMENTILL